MRRVVAYLVWKAEWWESRAELRAATMASDSSVFNGVSAYARKQASLLRHLADSSVSLWSPTLPSMGITINWATTLDANMISSAKLVADDESDNSSDDGDDDVTLEIDACIINDDF
jgi:hypothetical protein